MGASFEELLRQAGVNATAEEVEKLEPLFRLYTEGLRRLREVPLIHPEAALAFTPLPES